MKKAPTPVQLAVALLAVSLVLLAVIGYYEHGIVGAVIIPLGAIVGTAVANIALGNIP